MMINPNIKQHLLAQNGYIYDSSSATFIKRENGHIVHTITYHDANRLYLRQLETLIEQRT
jgi:hypothetical protein